MSRRKVSQRELDEMLAKYAACHYVGFRGLDFRGLDFNTYNFAGVDLQGADLRDADLPHACFRRACLTRVNFAGARLDCADLYDADLTGANLRHAFMSYANLTGATLHGANLHGTRLPSPTMVLLANWGVVSPKLCRDLMRYDAWSHPGPSAFDRWAAGTGQCPYSGIKWERAARFDQSSRHWSPGPAQSPYKLAARLLRKYCKGRDELPKKKKKAK